MVDPPLTVGLVHDTLRVPFDGVGSTDTLSGTGATTYICEMALCLISRYHKYYTLQCR